MRMFPEGRSAKDGDRVVGIVRRGVWVNLSSHDMWVGIGVLIYFLRPYSSVAFVSAGRLACNNR